MSSNHQVRSYLNYGVTVPASTTQAVAQCTFNDSMRTNLVADVVVGQVAGTPTLNLQDSTGLGNWSTVKSATLAASTDKTVTVSGNTWTSAAHGYMAGTLVVINSTGQMPSPMIPGTRAFVQNPTANTFQLTLINDPKAAPIQTTDSGTGTLTVTAATWTTMRLNVNVAGDQAVMPLRPQGRLQAACSGGQSVQILDFRLGYVY